MRRLRAARDREDTRKNLSGIGGGFTHLSMLCVNPVQACHTSFAHVRFCALRTGLSSGNGDDLGDFGGAR